MQLREHQSQCLDDTQALMDEGVRRICVTAPTGAGKSLIMVKESERAINNGMRVGLFTPRKMLTDQLIGYFEDMRIPFSVRAAGYEDLLDDDRPIQICSTKTEHVRVGKTMKLDELRADMVLVDEAHLQRTGVNREVIEKNIEDGATLIGYTATPVALKGMYERLVTAGTVSSLREQGYLLPAWIYEAGCPDLGKIKRLPSGEFSHGQLQAAGYTQVIVGHVIDHYLRLNPHGLPTILFAPGLPESKWFVDQFAKRGIRFAHIDGDDIYVDGEEYTRSGDAKDQLLSEISSGKLMGISNRFVCREGVDIPELYYGILATPIGSLVSYLQAIGRLLRPHGDMEHVVISDHGGNRDRHGSPNEDRHWDALWGLTSPQIESIRKQGVQDQSVDKGFPCPSCGLVWGQIPESGICKCGHRLSGVFACRDCGHEHRYWPLDCICKGCGTSMRGVRKKAVIYAGGELRLVSDNEYRPKKELTSRDQSNKLWSSYFWRLRKYRPHMSLAQVWGKFKMEHHDKLGTWPPRDLELMPIEPHHWHIPTGDLDFKELYSRQRPENPQKRLF